MNVEWCLVAGLLAAALGPLGLRARRAAVWGGLVLLGASAMAGVWTWQQRLERRENSLREARAQAPLEERPGGYVRAESCRACHPEQYDSWHDSFHRTMTQRATPESVRGDFGNVTITFQGDSYRFYREHEEYWVEMVDPDWQYVQMLRGKAAEQGAVAPPVAPSNPPRTKKRITLLTGSHAMQAYWVCSAYGNMQFSLPFTYVFEMNRWVPRNDVFLLPPSHRWIQQVWNVNCINCHATAGQPRQDPRTSVIDSRVGELGIACEACHGPGDEHVRANRDPKRRYALHASGQPDPTIFNPARADHIKASQACGQCHAIRHRPNKVEWNAEGLRFKPGEELETCAPLVLYDNAGLHAPGNEKKRDLMEGCYWPDGSARVSGRDYNGLAASPCFQRGQLSCLSCHSLHRYQSTDDQLARGMDGNQACLQCHAKYTANLEAHTRHRADSSGSLCYNCHMPHTTYGLLKAIRSHEISSPSLTPDRKAGRPNACNLCHLDRSLGWTSQKLNEWWGRPAPNLTPDQESVAASVVLALSGDAGQRALVAWHFGWEPARRASGEDWIAPFAGHLLADPYSTVRYIAGRSLQRLPGFTNFAYDYIAPGPEREAARERALGTWRKLPPAPARPAVLQPAPGELAVQKFSELHRRRDDRPMELLE